MRFLWVIVVTVWCCCALLRRAIGAILTGQRKRVPSIAGEILAIGCERIGGAFLKAGQILSSRVDLLPPETISALARLRDNVQPLKFNQLEAALHPLRQPIDNELCLDIESSPLASATIAQVHVGRVSSTRQQFAIKVCRPDIERLLTADVSYIRFFTRLTAHLPWFRQFPISETTEEVCAALLHQVDFFSEAKMLGRFNRLFADTPNIIVPEVDMLRCTSNLIVMEYLDGYRPIQAFRDQPELAKTAVQTGLRALYKMIFNAGLIHCDLHASNILCNEEGQVALLDFGFVSEMTPKAKQDFAEFFLGIAFQDGKITARIVMETAIRINDNLDPEAFTTEMQQFVEKTAGLRASDFQVASFVFELFQIQRRHGIFGSPSFTLPILSLLTYEGLIKDIYPDLDFQQEAVPFIMQTVAVT